MYAAWPGAASKEGVSEYRAGVEASGGAGRAAIAPAYSGAGPDAAHLFAVRPAPR